MDDVWQGTFDVPAGGYEYKAALNNSWTENYGDHAQSNGGNIPLNLAAAASVKFYYSHETHWITDNKNAVIAVAPGSFQHYLGCAGDWQPDCLRSWLQDPDGDGIYTFSTRSLPAGSYEAKVAINESWAENYGAGGASNGANIPFTVASDCAETVFSYNAADPRAHHRAPAPAAAQPSRRASPSPAASSPSSAAPATGSPTAPTPTWPTTRPTASGRGPSTSRPEATSTRRPLNDSWDVELRRATRSRTAPTSASTSPRRRRSSSITMTRRTG